VGVSPPVLLCDYGGVLTTSLLGAAEQVCREVGVEHVGFRAALRTLRSTDDPVARLERGEITTDVFEEQFVPQLTQALEGRLDGAEFLWRLEPLVRPEPRMLEAVDLLHKAGVRTALVSNSWSANYPPEALERFDHVFLSGPLGMRKPDEEIYRHVLAALRVEPGECCFVDDFEANIATAAALGMRTILHTTVETTLPALTEVFGVPLSALTGRPRLADV
jgi:putative hydrolase of the HAD superfamily